MKYNSAYYSSIGGRKENGDSSTIVEFSGTVLAVIADGLGGHAYGKKASSIAVQTITSALNQRNLSVLELEKAIQAANSAIAEEKLGGGMKSTAAILWMDRSNALIAHIGDSRVYQFRNDRIRYQTTDHTLLQLEVTSGKRDPKSVRKNPGRSYLLRALGIKDDVRADICGTDVKPGDAFLLCTDGFWDNIWEDEMLETLQESDDSTAWLESMKHIAKERMGWENDNHSATAIRLTSC